MLLMALGVVAVAMTGGGTFASFDAQVTNPGNTFVAGTLFLHDTNGTTTCTSESAQSATFNYNPGDGSNGDNCAVLFNGADLSSGPVTADLELSNAGTIDASQLKFSVDGCTVGDNSANTGTTTTFGAAPTCGDLYMTVQETQSDYSTKVWCAYGPGAGTANCGAPDNTATLADPTSLTSLDVDSSPALAAGAARYYVITIDPAGVSSGNQLQNRSVSFGLTWNIAQ
jgi:predicted ribosomally synthesized peptide with SipW-like signal peptide